MRRFLPTLLFLLIVAVAIAWWTWPAALPDAAPPGAGRPALAAGTASVQANDLATEAGLAPQRLRRARRTAHAPATAAMAQGAPLPPLDAALLDIAGELQARAAAGETAAICRLAAEIAACNRASQFEEGDLEYQLASLQEALQAHPDRNNDTGSRFAQRLQQDLAAVRRCRGAPRHLLQDQARHDLRAAQAGDPGAMSRFVEGAGVTAGDLMRDPALGPLYQQHAWPLFLRLLEAGDPRAAMAWMETLEDRGHSQLRTVLPPDWQDRALARSLFRRILATNPELDSPELQERWRGDPATEDRAQAMFDRYFLDAPRFARQAGELLEFVQADPRHDCGHPL